MGEKKADDLAERGGKPGKTAPKNGTRRTVEKVGQGECEAGVESTAPVSDTRRTREKIGQGEGEAGVRITAPKSSTRRTVEKVGQVECESGGGALPLSGNWSAKWSTGALPLLRMRKRCWGR